MDLRVGMFVRFTDKDGTGKYHYDGELVSLEHNEITFDIGVALLTVPMIEQDKFQEVERPADFKRGTYPPEKPVLELSRKIGTSTRERVAEIVRQNPEASRKDLITLCGEQGISAGSASTYIALARKG